MKKAIALLLALIMVLSLAACGGDKPVETQPKDDKPVETKAPEAGESKDPVAEEGKVFNIYAWNEEFKGFFEKYYKVPEGITVNWIITPNDGGAYKNKLDEALLNQENVPADEKIDMFLLEVDHNIMQYTNSPYTMDIQSIGVTDFSNTYAYTVQAASDASGVIKGVSFQCCPAALIYRRSIALDVLGTDDPAEVQALLDSWDKFNSVAADAKAKGYYMTASEAATFRVFSNNTSAPLVQDGKLVLDDAIKTWQAQAKDFADKGYTLTADIWSDECTAQMFAEGKTMCYFGPAWYFNFSMGNAQDPEKGCPGDWAIVQGPQAHFWGGTWLLAPTGSDNPTMVADIMNAFINDEEVCTNLIKNEAQFTNNQAVNKTVAEDPTYGNAFLGGQNDVAVFLDLAKNIKFENKTIYDQLLTEGLQGYWREYCDGTVTEEEAMANYYKYINEKYPEIVTP